MAPGWSKKSVRTRKFVFQQCSVYISWIFPSNRSPIDTTENASMAEVRLERVSKVYDGKVTAVRDVDVTIRDR